MSDFIQTNQNLFLTRPFEAPVTPAGTDTVRTRKNDLQYSTGMDKATVDQNTDENGKPITPVTYKDVGTAGTSAVLVDKINNGASLESLQNQVSKNNEVDTALRKMEVISAVDAATANDDAVSAAAWKTQKRVAQLQNRLMDHIENSSGGAIDTVFEFLDSVAYETYAGIADFATEVTGGGTEQTLESNDIYTAARTMNDEEYAIWEKNYIDNVASKGLLENIGETSSWPAYKALTASEGAGFILHDKEWGYVSAAGAAVDVATLGLAGVTKAAKVGRSLIGRLRGTAGTLRATEAAESTDLVLRTGLDGQVLDEQLAIAKERPTIEGTTPPKSTFGGRVKNVDAVQDAEIIDDMIPEAMASKIKPTETPPVSFSSVKRKWTERVFTSQFLKREARHSFGASYIGATARNWAETQASKLAEASSTKLINFDFVHEGMQNYKASVTFGKIDGTPFKTFKAAQKEMSKFPNAVIVDTRTNKVISADTKSGQYVIRSETRVPYADVVDPMDLTEKPINSTIGKLLHGAHGTRLGRYFAASHYGSSSYLSNLADAAEFGHLGYNKDVEFAFKEINKLSHDELDGINKVLTTLRDTPTKGSAKTWLRTDEFISSYTLAKGSAPSLNVVKGYEHLVAMSDFSWYTMASDRLRAMASQKASILDMLGGNKSIVYPTRQTVKSLKDIGRQVWLHDAATGKRVSVKGLSDDQSIMAFGHRTSDYSDYVVNFEGKLRLPDLEDAYPYNAGGPRSNPDLAYFIGDVSNGWSTLIGSKTEKEAKIAIEQYNNVSRELHKILGEELPDDVVGALSKEQKTRLNTLIENNRDWNTSIEDIQDFVKFSKERGVKPNKQLLYKERNAKLATFKDLNSGINDPHLLDMSVEKYSSYSRHDIALREFGGELTSNPDPVLAVAHQFNHMATRAAQTQYRMEATTSWVKAVEKSAKNGHISKPNVPLVPMTDEAKVRNYVIEGNTQAAIKLRKEQDVIRRRLNMYDGVAPQFADGLNKINRSTFEAIYNKSKLGGNIYKNTFSRVFEEGTNKIMALGFFEKIADLSQVVLQGAHIIPITSISPVNGVKGVTLAGFIRQAAREGSESLWSILEGKLSAFTNLTPEQNKALMEHIFDSGRGYMRGAIVEDASESIGVKGVIGKLGDVARIPFYAGENFQSTASRITAYLDTVDRFPKLKPNSVEFWNEVQKRDRTLSFAMNSAQKSLAQSGSVSKVLTQWTAYPLRAIETVMFGELTAAERTRFVATQAMLWGFSGLGLYEVGQSITEGMPDYIREFIVKGLGDSLLSHTVGVELGSRLGLNIPSLIERGYSTVADPLASVPAFKISGDTARPALQAVTHFASGRWSLASHDVATLARAWKIVDNPVMAYQMLMEDVRISRMGVKTEGPFTTSQEFFQLIGYSPSNTTDESNIRNMVFNIKERQALAIKAVLPYTKDAFNSFQQRDFEAGISMLKDVDAALQGYGLSGTSLREAKDEIFKKMGYQESEFIIKTLLKEGYEDLAIQYAGEH